MNRFGRGDVSESQAPQPSGAVDMWDEISMKPKLTPFLDFYNRHTVYSIFIFYLFTKGMIGGVGILFLLQVSFCRETLEVDARQCQVIGVIASVPWSLRGLIAVLLCNLKEYALKYASSTHFFKTTEVMFIVLATVICVTSLFVLALGQYSSVTAGVLISCVNFGICALDVIFNGMYSKMVKMGHVPSSDGDSSSKEEDHASTLVFLSATTYQIGAILAASIVGPVVQFYSPRIVFFIAAMLACTNLIPVYCDWLGEIDVSSSTGDSPTDMSVYKKFRNVSLLTGVVAICNSFLSTHMTEAHSLAIYALISIVLLAVFNFFELSVLNQGSTPQSNDAKAMLLSKPPVDHTVFYTIGTTIIVMQTTLFVNVFAAEAYFLTEKESCNSNMPQFSYIAFNTTGAILSAISGWLGIIVFRKIFKPFTIQGMFVTTMWLQLSSRSLRAFMPVGFFGNAAALNWPYFIAIYCIISPLVTYVYTMPSVMLIPNLVPTHQSTLAFAAVVSLQSYSRVAASQLGLLGIELANLQHQSPCDFCNLWIIQIVGQVALPMLMLPILYSFLPKIKL